MAIVADELHQGDRLAHPGAAEEPDLAALVEGADEVDDLDAGFQDLHRRGLVHVGRGLAVDGPVLLGADGPAAVHRRAEHVHDASRGSSGRPAPRSAPRCCRPRSRASGRRWSPSRWCAPPRRRSAAGTSSVRPFSTLSAS